MIYATTDLILRLQIASGATLAACKHALEACGGDPDLAQAFLQKQKSEELDSLESATGLDRAKCQELLKEWGSVERALKHVRGRQAQAQAGTAGEPGRRGPSGSRRLEEVLRLDDPKEVVSELNGLLADKQTAGKARLSDTERAFMLVASMQEAIMWEGFQDLFYQKWSLADCILAEATLRELGAKQLARLLQEAREIYTRHKPEMTEEEYQELDPFDLPEPDGERFDEIADLVSADDSQLFELDTPLAKFARKYRRRISL